MGKSLGKGKKGSKREVSYTRFLSLEDIIDDLVIWESKSYLEMIRKNKNSVTTFFAILSHGTRARVAEYLVLLEYAHLSNFNHQKAFNKILANVCHEFKKQEKELEKFIPADMLSSGVESI